MTDKVSRPFFPLKKLVTIAVVVIIVAAAVLTVSGAAVTVPAGYKGVLLNWGKPIEVLDSGFHWVSPVGQEVAAVNIQIQKAEAEESAASSDLQEVTTSVTVNYQIDVNYVMDVYTNLRDQYESRVIIPAMQDGLKASTAKYQASELITRREDAKNSFQSLLQDKLQQYHIVIVSVSITNFKFSDQFQAAIDAKVTTEQNALAAKNQLEVIQFSAQQQIIQAEANATATIAQAIGKANATIIAANATAQAIEIIKVQLTPEYIQYLTVQGWNGQLPIYWGSNGMPFLLIPVNPPNSTETLP
jgi:regulator of protease activity HflC (stomatin/prohibitin superfamily)